MPEIYICICCNMYVAWPATLCLIPLRNFTCHVHALRVAGRGCWKASSKQKMSGCSIPTSDACIASFSRSRCEAPHPHHFQSTPFHVQPIPVSSFFTCTRIPTLALTYLSLSLSLIWCESLVSLSAEEWNLLSLRGKGMPCVQNQIEREMLLTRKTGKVK